MKLKEYRLSRLVSVLETTDLSYSYLKDHLETICNILHCGTYCPCLPPLDEYTKFFNREAMKILKQELRWCVKHGYMTKDGNGYRINKEKCFKGNEEIFRAVGYLDEIYVKLLNVGVGNTFKVRDVGAYDFPQLSILILFGVIDVERVEKNGRYRLIKCKDVEM